MSSTATAPVSIRTTGLIGDGSSRTGLFIGYLVGAGIMLIDGFDEWLIGINAEDKSLEAITEPLIATNPKPAPA